MIGRSLSLIAVLVLALAAPVAAADSLSFDDPGMHFSAPADWTRVDIPSGGGGGGPNDSQDDAPVAAFVYHRGQPDQRTITIKIAPYEGSLESFASHHETEVRSGADSTYIEKRAQITLANGMPAYYLRIGSGSDAGHFARRYEYLVYDGKRSIVVTYTGRQGDFGDDDAKAALSTLYVVAYPRPHA
jgi:hypothetical protein